MKEEIKYKIESTLKEKLGDEFSVSGGCINDAKIIKTKSGNNYFFKTNDNCPPKMFINEANGLRELNNSNTIRVPKVVIVNDNFILLEAINSSSKSKFFFEDFGRNFAQLHKYFGANFGFYENNYIGSTPQLNIPEENEKANWVTFYFNKRLKFQFDLIEKNGYMGDELIKLFLALESKIDTILANSDEKPSLLHGDLWSGNFLVDGSGNACLIDPAVYYGHREADLAMTKLFGGFSSKFYSAYNELYPLPDGYEYRENIYKLYHVLNHLNLFGSSYYQQAIRLIKYYV